MNIVITAATTNEWKPAFLNINKLYTKKNKRLNVSFHVSGVGIAATAVSLTKLLCNEKPDLIIQMGIAGAFNNKEKLGKTFVIKNDCFADMGVEENKGINANEDGSFSIVSAFPKTDSLRISSVGYKTLILPVSAWVNESVVMLQQEIRELKEVIVSNRSKQTFILNKFRKCSWSIYKIGLNTISQLAQRFNAPAQGMQLTALELCKDDSESKFRIRIYDIDSTYKYPSNDLVDSVIEVTSKEGHVRINLEDYNIIIPGKSFFIAIEWLYIPFNIQLKKEKINGRRIVKAWYKPQIKLIERDQNAINEDIWELSFMGRWANRWVSKGVNFQITAELR